MDSQTANRLLLDCLRSREENWKDSEFDRLLPSDWEKIFQQAIRHDIVPLLYRRLQPLRSEVAVPSDILQRLRRIYLSNAARNMYLYRELAQVLLIFQHENIPVIVLKGAHLAEVVYEVIALRAMSDVDLLVKKKDLAKSQQKLLETGFYHRKRGFVIDLHWTLDDPLSEQDMEQIWNRAQPAIISGVDALVLFPEDLILHLCLHLTFHHLYQDAALRSLYDIREVIKHYSNDMEWSKVCCRAREWKVSRAVYLTLLLARDMIGARVPDEVLEELKPEEFDPHVKTWAVERILQQDESYTPVSQFFWQLWKPGPFRKKLWAFRRLLFPPPEFISQRYPVTFGSLRNYLYYLIRITDHIGPYAKLLWRIIRSDKAIQLQIQQQKQNMTMKEWLED